MLCIREGLLGDVVLGVFLCVQQPLQKFHKPGNYIIGINTSNFSRIKVKEKQNNTRAGCGGGFAVPEIQWGCI